MRHPSKVLVAVLTPAAVAVAAVRFLRGRLGQGQPEPVAPPERLPATDVAEIVEEAVRGVVEDGEEARVLGPGPDARFHRAGCRVLGSAAARELRRAEALDAGRSPCQVCAA
jgi:hypothetical protein